MNPFILTLIAQFSLIYHIDPRLAQSVVMHESNYNESAVGRLGEIGLFQIMPSTVPYMSKRTMFNVVHNIGTGIALMREAKNTCDHKTNNTWLVCYNRGLSHGNSVNNPMDDVYYKSVMKIYKLKQGVSHE